MRQSVETRLDGSTLVMRIPMRFQRRGGRKRIVAPDGSGIAPTSKPQPDGTLVKALARAWRWQQLLDDGVYSSVSEHRRGREHSKATSAGSCAWRCWRPTSSKRSSRDAQDQALMLEQLERPLPASWVEQRARILEPKTSLAV